MTFGEFGADEFRGGGGGWREGKEGMGGTGVEIGG